MLQNRYRGQAEKAGLHMNGQKYRLLHFRFIFSQPALFKWVLTPWDLYRNSQRVKCARQSHLIADITLNLIDCVGDVVDFEPCNDALHTPTHKSPHWPKNSEEAECLRLESAEGRPPGRETPAPLKPPEQQENLSRQAMVST